MGDGSATFLLSLGLTQMGVSMLVKERSRYWSAIICVSAVLNILMGCLMVLERLLGWGWRDG